ncbi:MAG TPA: acyltransferase family protein [Candidatus Limnocylindria bacterium]|nr:acyltransferase family protein [Candidatus Limnocylindria bacterium]
MFTERGAGYRPYLDGLRAIAVAGVIVYHLNPGWLAGGYLGVDLFFVLSGYLITTLLVNEHAKTGRIDLPAFWSRRVRRLMPALMLLLVAVAIGVLLSGDELAAASARGDMLATLFYVANWHFIWTDQSYFAGYVAASPVRHAWSLAIEEQFYLAWPLVVGLVLSRLGGRRTLVVLAALASVASVAAMWILFGTAADPSRAYYGTDARIYQLLIGAILAVALQGRWRATVLAAARPMAVPALLAVGGMMVLLTDDSALYYRGGGPAFAVASAVLIAGLEGGSRLARPLSIAPMVVIGLVSYGLYLWHWPVILFVGQAVGATSGLPPALLAVALTAVLAAISYVAVERPIRRGGRIGPVSLQPRRLLGLVPATSAVVAGVILLGTSFGSTPPWASTSGEVPPGATVTIGEEGEPVVGVVGDSVMVSALPGLRVEAQSRGWTLVEAAFAGCPVGYEPLYDAQGVESSFSERCLSVRPAHDALIDARPDVVIWHDLQSVLSRRSESGDLLPAGTSSWAEDLLAEWQAVLDRLTAGGSQVLIIMPPRRSIDEAGCGTAVNAARCREVQAQDELMRATTMAFWERIDGRDGVHLVDVDRIVCPDGYPCPTALEGISIRRGPWDQTHFSEEGAAWFARRLFDEALRPAAGGAPTLDAARP